MRTWRVFWARVRNLFLPLYTSEYHRKLLYLSGLDAIPKWLDFKFYTEKNRNFRSTVDKEIFESSQRRYFSVFSRQIKKSMTPTGLIIYSNS